MMMRTSDNCRTGGMQNFMIHLSLFGADLVELLAPQVENAFLIWLWNGSSDLQNCNSDAQVVGIDSANHDRNEHTHYPTLQFEVGMEQLPFTEQFDAVSQMLYSIGLKNRKKL